MRLRTDDTAHYWFSVCVSLAEKSGDFKTKHGAVLVAGWDQPHAQVAGRGYNHTVGGLKCEDCPRQKDRTILSGQRLELCYAVHAEQAAMLDAARKGNIPSTTTFTEIPRLQYTMYDVGVIDGEVVELPEPMFSCTFCARLMAEFGVSYVCVYVAPGEIWELTMQEALESAYEFALR